MPKSILRPQKVKNTPPTKGFFRRQRFSLTPPESPTCATELFKVEDCRSDDSISTKPDPISVVGNNHQDEEKHCKVKAMNFALLNHNAAVSHTFEMDLQECFPAFGPMDHSDNGVRQLNSKHVVGHDHMIAASTASPIVEERCDQIKLDHNVSCNSGLDGPRHMVCAPTSDEYGRVAESDKTDEGFDSPYSELSAQTLFDLTASTLKAQRKTLKERGRFIARIQALEKLLEEQRKEEYVHCEKRMESDERDCLNARIQALEKLVKEQRKEDRAHRNTRIQLETKSLEVKELVKLVHSLKQQLSDKQDMVEQLKEECDSHKEKILELNDVVTNCLHKNSATETNESLPHVVMSHELKEECDSHQENAIDLNDVATKCVHKNTVKETNDSLLHVLMSQEGPSSTEDSSMHNTMDHLMKIIEFLEDERNEFVSEIHALRSTVLELKHEREARELKISVLESQFEAMEKQFKAMEVAKMDGPLSCHYN